MGDTKRPPDRPTRLGILDRLARLAEYESLRDFVFRVVVAAILVGAGLYLLFTNEDPTWGVGALGLATWVVLRRPPKSNWKDALKDWFEMLK